MSYLGCALLSAPKALSWQRLMDLQDLSIQEELHQQHTDDERMDLCLTYLKVLSTTGSEYILHKASPDVTG